MLDSNRTGAKTADYLVDLVYELLDAHCDTITLAEETSTRRQMQDRLGWAAHLDYLRGLQRVGREALARLPSEQPTT